MKRGIRFSTIFIGFITLWGLALFVGTIQRATSSPILEPEVEMSEQYYSISTEARPKALSIPRLEVDAQVQHVGMARSGRMAVPTNYTDVGWYRYGVSPGQSGNAVFAGHLDNGFGRPGVFNRLQELEVNDDIFITNEDGQRLHFKVMKTEQLSADTFSTSSVFTGDNGAFIKLITCEGQWDSATKTYSERLVITARLIPD
ncbi:class F sortase [Candidatus Parcubacteria bacterium]|nr:class F sortase [Candidatus Parcubacteria bacterium]